MASRRRVDPRSRILLAGTVALLLDRRPPWRSTWRNSGVPHGRDW